jgi:hypothetical protein
VNYEGKIKVLRHKRHLEVLQSRQKWLELPKYDDYERSLRRSFNALHPTQRVPSDSDIALNKKRSLYRTKNVIHELIVNNDFNYWLTLTFDKSKYDSDNREFVISSFRDLRRWFNSQSIKYVAVLEKHVKSGYHIHLILKASDNFHNDYFAAAINRKQGSSSFGKKLVGKYDSFVKWSFGFSNLIHVLNDYDSSFKIANYMRKYMTKQLFDELGRKRYWCSRGLNRAKTLAVLTPNSLDGFKFNNESANYRRSIIKLPDVVDSDTPFEELQHVPFELLDLLFEDKDT